MKTENMLPSIRLEYPKGELIVKEGDYGISMYQILEGRVGVYVSSGDVEIEVNTLEAGEIIGEMIFLAGNKTRRTASVRALEDSVLEAWHPSRIIDEFKAMPDVIRYITNQTVNHLIRVDRKLSELARNKELAKLSKKERKEIINQRMAARREVHLDCLYRPVQSDEKVRLWGRVKDISNSGMRLEVMRLNSLDYSHASGDEFKAIAFLPNKKQLEVKVKICYVKPLEDKKNLAIGMQFLELAQDPKVALGFLLL